MGVRRVSESLALLAVLSMVGLVAFRPVFAVDLFWLLALGREIVQTGAIPRTDLFSAVHPDAPWVQFQWLWEVVAFATVDGFGLTGLRALQAGMLTATFLALYALSRRRGHGVAGAGLLLATGLLLFVDRFRLRPDALNLALMLPMLPVVAGGYRCLRAPGRALVALWCFLWAGLHGGGVLWALFAAGALLAGAAIDRARTARTGDAAPGDLRAALWLLGSCLAGACVSPTTLPGLLHFFSIYGRMSAGSPEWSPIWTAFTERPHPVNALLAATPILVGLAYGSTLVRHARRMTFDSGQVLLAVGCLGLACAILRMAFLALVPMWLWLDARREAPGEPHRERLAMLLTAGGLVLGLAHYAVLGPRGSLQNAVTMAATFDLEPGAFPEEAVDFVASAGLTGKMMNGRAAGGPLILFAYPAIHVLSDSRHNLTPELWHLTLGIERPEYQARAADAGFVQRGLELVLLQAPLVRVRPLSSDWQLLFRAGRSEVYQHLRGAHAGPNLAATRRRLRELGQEVSPTTVGHPLAVAATAAGAARFLDHPFRRRQRARIEALLRHKDARDRDRARRVLARMLLDAGDLDGARTALAGLERPDTPRTALYRAELAFELGDVAAARAPLAVAAAHASTLPREEQRAVQALLSIAAQ